MDSSSVEIAVGTWAVGHCCNTEQLYTAAVGKKKKTAINTYLYRTCCTYAPGSYAYYTWGGEEGASCPRDRSLGLAIIVLKFVGLPMAVAR